MSSLPDDAPAPRLCIIVKWADFEGYGFNLHAEKSKPGQYIGKVDDNSPAEAAGLLEDDRIIEVNGVNIANENHKQVVQRIKAVPNETRLLVVDPQTDKYYKSKNIVVRGTQENVLVRSSARERKAPATPQPQSQPSTSVSNGHHEESDNRSVSSAASSSAASESSTQPQHAATLADTDKDAKVEEASTHEPMEDKKSRSPSPSTAETDKSSEEASAPEKDGASLSGSDKLSEEKVSAAVEDFVPEAREADASHCEEPHEGREHALPEANAPVEEETQQPSKEEEEEEERSTEAAAAAPPTDQDSDLEAEYDNVEIGDGRAAGAPAEAAPDKRRLSASSGDSHSSHGADTARTDPHTQSPMSTSPTPPPSLEPAQESVRSSTPPASTTNSTTTNNASPRTQASNNNAYSPGSVVVVVMTGSTLQAASTTTTTPTTTTPTTSPRSQPNNNATNSSGLNLNMSAAEMRAKLASRKKADPRKDTVDLKKKYEIIQNM